MITSRISSEGVRHAVHGLASEAALYAATAFSAIAAAIHLWAAPEHFGEWAGYGAFFLIAAILQGVYGLALLSRPTQKVFILGVGSNLALVAFYVATRTAGIPFFGPHAWEVHPAAAMDLFCVAAELGLVGLSSSARGGSPPPGATSPSAWRCPSDLGSPSTPCTPSTSSTPWRTSRRASSSPSRSPC